MLRFRLEFERDAVHAIPQPGGTRAVGEHVAEMAAAFRAVHFSARHEQTAIDRRLDGIFERRKKTRPSRSALELRLRGKKRLPAAAAVEGAAPFFHVQRAAARTLGPVLAQHVKLLRGEFLAPVIVLMLHDQIVMEDPASTVSFQLPSSTSQVKPSRSVTFVRAVLCPSDGRSVIALALRSNVRHRRKRRAGGRRAEGVGYRRRAQSDTRRLRTRARSASRGSGETDDLIPNRTCVAAARPRGPVRGLARRSLGEGGPPARDPGLNSESGTQNQELGTRNPGTPGVDS